MASNQTGHKLLNLMTGQIIIRGRVTIVPITQMNIDKVEQLVQNDGIINGLKLHMLSNKFDKESS